MRICYLAVVAALCLSACASTGGVPPRELQADLKCDGPDFNEVDSKGRPVNDEEGMARRAELLLQAHGVHGAHSTRWWHGCLQTFVNIDGHEVMKFYDPWSYDEVTFD